MHFSFKRTYEDIVQKQVDVTDAAAELVRSRRLAWDDLASLAELHFNIVKAAAEQRKWFDYLYVSRSNTLRTVQMHMGNHPVGVTADGPLILESGATVVLSQSSTGSVIIVLFPYASAAQKMHKPYIVWNVTDYPTEIKRSTMIRLVTDFMIYARVSSAILAASKADRQRIEKLEERSRILQGKVPPLYFGRTARTVLSAASAALLVVFGTWTWEALTGNKQPQPQWEPVAGLIILISGWLATLLKENRDARRAAEVEERATLAINDATQKP